VVAVVVATTANTGLYAEQRENIPDKKTFRSNAERFFMVPGALPSITSRRN